MRVEKMSLDLYFKSKIPKSRKKGTGVFIREDGGTRELQTPEEVLKYFPNYDISKETMADTGELTYDIWHGNITHNLGKLARHVPIAESTLYQYLWRPEEIGYTELNSNYVKGLEIGLRYLENNKEALEIYLPSIEWETGRRWGEYGDLVRFVEDALRSIKKVDEPVEIIASR